MPSGGIVANALVEVVLNLMQMLVLKPFGVLFNSSLAWLPYQAHLAQIALLLIPSRNREHIVGDLEEEYRTSHKRFPRLWYLGQIIALVANYWYTSCRRLAGLDVILKLIRK